MHKLSPTRVAYDFIRALEAKQFRQVMNKILSLLVDAKPADSIVLQGYEDLLRVDIGEFRIIYRFDNQDTITVLLVGKRNDDEVYKKLDRKKHS